MYIQLKEQLNRKIVYPWQNFSDCSIAEYLQQQQQHSLFSQASWGRLEMKPERNKFKI